MALTDMRVKSVKADEKQIKIYDTGGLFLLVVPTKKGRCGKRWRLKYYFDGKEKLLALGTYPEVTLGEARKRRDEARQQVAQNLDPAKAKKLEKIEQAEKQANTFELLARNWIKHRIGTISERTTKDIVGRLEHDVFKVIGDIPLVELTPRLVLEKVLRPVESRGAIETAHRIRGVISQVMRYGVACGLCDRDITADLRGALKPVQRKHHAAFDAGGTTDSAKVGGLLRAIDGFDGSFIVKCALRFHPYVATRPGELRHAEWSEIDLDTETWSIPAGKMKMKNPHVVPLSEPALAILREIHQLTGSGKYVFPSMRSAVRPISDNTMNAALRRLGYSKDEIVSHGWRAIFRTLADEVLQERVDIIESQLAHQVADVLGRAYNRTSFLKERRELMVRWAQYLEELKANRKE